jgi:hypothetical protein
VGYDTIGNITTKDGVGTYNYTEDGKVSRPHAVQNVSAKAGKVIDLKYDDFGNVIHRSGDGVEGESQEVSYSSFNLPTLVTLGTGSQVHYQYTPARTAFKLMWVTALTRTAPLAIAASMLEVPTNDKAQQTKTALSSEICTRFSLTDARLHKSSARLGRGPALRRGATCTPTTSVRHNSSPMKPAKSPASGASTPTAKRSEARAQTLRRVRSARASPDRKPTSKRAS